MCTTTAILRHTFSVSADDILDHDLFGPSTDPRISVCPPRRSELKKARTPLHKSFQLIVFDASYIHSVSVIYMNTELKAVKIPSHD